MPKQKVCKKSSTAAKHKVGGSTSANGGASAKILNVAAAVAAQTGKFEVPRKQIVVLVGKMGKSTVANALTNLKNEGLIEFTAATITVTLKGMDAADVDSANVNLPTTNAELHKSTKETYKLNKMQIVLFDHLADGGTYNKVEVKDALDIGANSTWANLMTSLKKLEIVEFDRTTIRLTDKMFEIDGRP